VHEEAEGQILQLFKQFTQTPDSLNVPVGQEAKHFLSDKTKFELHDRQLLEVN
jgi:hypothetical protein